MRMPKTANLTGLNCAARGSLKYRTQKIAKKSLSAHHRTTLSGYIFATKARVDNRKKVVKQQYLLHMSSQYGELRPTSGWDLLASFGHPSKFQRVLRLGSVTARHLVSQTLRRWTEGATFVRQGYHQVGHWPTFYFRLYIWQWILNWPVLLGRPVSNMITSSQSVRILQCPIFVLNENRYRTYATHFGYSLVWKLMLLRAFLATPPYQAYVAVISAGLSSDERWLVYGERMNGATTVRMCVRYSRWMHYINLERRSSPPDGTYSWHCRPSPPPANNISLRAT